MPSVQRVRWAKFRVVATAVVALAILSTLVVLLSGGTLFEPKVTLYLYLPDATGLAQSSPVRVDGVEVGTVESVGLSDSTEPSRVVRVTMKIERRLLSSITLDSTAQAAADTVVGDKFIQITTGKSPERVQPGEEIRYKGSTDLMTSLDLSQFRQSLDKMDALLTDIEDGESRLGQFIMTDTMYRDLLHRVAELESGIRAAADTTSSVGRELYTDSLYQQISGTIRRLDDTLVRLQTGQGSFGPMLLDTAQHDQITAQVVSLHKSVAAIRGSEFLTSGASYDAWNKAAVGLIQQVDAFSVSPAMASSEVYDNLVGMAKELQGTTKEFRENPRKFLWMKLF
ncbi:MAG TPA: MlaD family protein [Candidatus Acidoferrum sp.]|nr:MlaD family protein [Candidatus Acidoferrum sp.]